ncbi:unnamed protein product [Brassica oleracea var. botrytis]
MSLKNSYYYLRSIFVTNYTNLFGLCFIQNFNLYNFFKKSSTDL